MLGLVYTFTVTAVWCLYAMGAAASFEAVSHMNKEELAAYATDNKAPDSVVRVIKENQLDGPTLSVLEEADVEELGKTKIEKKQLVGYYRRVDPNNTTATPMNSPRQQSQQESLRGGSGRKNTFYNDDIDEQLLIHDVNFNDLFSNRIALLCGCDDYSKIDAHSQHMHLLYHYL